MHIDHLLAPIPAPETDTATVVARAYDGPLSPEEIEELGRHAFARIALVRGQLKTRRPVRDATCPPDGLRNPRQGYALPWP